MPSRKNGVYLFHEILSFSSKDKEKLNESIMFDLASRYLNMRAGRSLGYAKAHFDTENPHIHILISANLLRSSKKLRLSQGQFQQVKKELEKYQKKRYPELENSIVFGKERGKEHSIQGAKEGERKRRLKKQGEKDNSQKKQVYDAVLSCIGSSYSENQFHKNLQEAGFDFYVRGKTAGVQEKSSGRKYRLKTLELNQEYLRQVQNWDKRKQRAKEIENIKIKKELLIDKSIRIDR